MNLYYCKTCGKSVQRDSKKAWMKSYCEASGKITRITRVKASGRIRHKASLVNNKGQASALCYSKPRAIPLSETWTMEGEVTCKKCLKIMAKWFVESIVYSRHYSKLPFCHQENYASNSIWHWTHSDRCRWLSASSGLPRNFIYSRLFGVSGLRESLCRVFNALRGGLVRFSANGES